MHTKGVTTCSKVKLIKNFKHAKSFKVGLEQGTWQFSGWSLAALITV
jgi:hypothetical protein